MPKQRMPKKMPNAPDAVPAPETTTSVPPAPPAVSSLPFAESTPRADKSGKARVSFAITPDGRVDWDSMQDAKRQNLEAVLKADPRIMMLVNPDVQQAGLITPGHVERWLDLIGAIERMAVPPIAKAKFKWLDGTPVVFDPIVIDRCFRFTEQQKKDIGPPGAAVANEYLPDAVQSFLVKTDNVGILIGLLGEAVQGQIQGAMAMQLTLMRQQQQAAPTAPVSPVEETSMVTN